MENYDINRQGYHDSHDTMENIDLDYGSAVAAIAIESVARAATEKPVTVDKQSGIEAQCVAKGMRMTEQRRIIARVLASSADHPDVEELKRRCAEFDDKIRRSEFERYCRREVRALAKERSCDCRCSVGAGG